MTELIFHFRPWLSGIALMACMLLAAETGFRAGRKSSLDVEQKADIRIVQAAILGVLALLLGFTVSMSVSRFDSRRLLTVDEANAIGTAHLRAQLMPAPEGPEIADLLRQYVDGRVRFFAASVSSEAVRASTAQLQKAMWLRVNSLVQRDNRSLPTGLLVQSLNQVFDLENSSWAAGKSHVPATVIWLNAAIAILSSLFLGYLFGVSGRRQVFAVALQAIAISAVLASIVDLDLPERGLIRISRQPMIDLQKALAPSHH